MSWIALADEIGAIRAAIDNDAFRGPVNLVAPNPVTNAEFARHARSRAAPADGPADAAAAAEAAVRRRARRDAAAREPARRARPSWKPTGSAFRYPCSSPRSKRSCAALMRLWIDTDIGDDPDDTVALWCAARSSDAELVGVSTVDGDVAAPRRAACATCSPTSSRAPDRLPPDAARRRSTCWSASARGRTSRAWPTPTRCRAASC